jgi:serine/threonine protein kinase
MVEDDQNGEVRFTDNQGKERHLCFKDEIGKGGFATVYLGWDASDRDDMYAIKKVDLELLKTKQLTTEMIEREIETMKKVATIDNFVTLIGHHQDEKFLYLIMEVANCGDLDQFIILRGGYLREKEAQVIVRQLI